MLNGAYCIVDVRDFYVSVGFQLIERESAQLKGFSMGQFSQMKDLAQRSFTVSQDYYRPFSSYAFSEAKLTFAV